MTTMRTRRAVLTLLAAVISIVAGLTSVTHAKAHKPSGPQLAEQNALAAKTSASYEQIRPAIAEIKVGDARAAVLDLMRDKMKLSIDDRQVFEVRENGQRAGLLMYQSAPGVLTPFDTRAYFSLWEKPDALAAIHFGYVEGLMLRPRTVVVLEKGVVSQIVTIPEPTQFLYRVSTGSNRDPVADESATKPELAQQSVQLPAGAASLSKELMPSIYGKKPYEDVFLPKKDQIVIGMHWWEVFTLLSANYLMSPDLQGFTIVCPGFLNAQRTPESNETADGIRTVYPFGYMEGDVEYPQWEIVMLNRRVVEVRPYKAAKQSK
jgi:hypothetical protein